MCSTSEKMCTLLDVFLRNTNYDVLPFFQYNGPSHTLSGCFDKCALCFLCCPQSAQEVSVSAEPASSLQPLQRGSCSRVQRTFTTMTLTIGLYTSFVSSH